MTSPAEGPAPDVKTAINSTVACVAVLGGSLMPWATITARPTVTVGGNTMPMDAGLPLLGNIELTLNGFNGNLTIQGFGLPNFLVILSAAAVAVLLWLRAGKTLNPPIAWLVILCLYAPVHLLLTTIVASSANRPSLGAGLIVTAIGSILLMAVVLTSRRTEPSPPSMSP